MVNSGIAITATVASLVIGGLIFYVYSSSSSSGLEKNTFTPDYGRNSYVPTTGNEFRPSEGGGRRKNTSKNKKNNNNKKSKKVR